MFQLNLLLGLRRQGLVASTIISLAPFPAWPRGRRMLVHSRRVHLGEGLSATLLPYINVTPFKQLTIGLGVLAALLRWGLAHRHERRVVYTFNLSVPPGLFTLLGARLIGATLVASLNDINVPGQTVPDTVFNRIDFRLQRAIIPRLDGHVAVADSIMRDFAPGRRYLRMEGGITPETLSRTHPLPVVDDAHGRPFTAVAAGSLDEANGVTVVLEALAIMRGAKVRLVIVGDGPLRQSVLTAAAHDPRLEYRGLVSFEEVLELYNQADVLLNVRLTRAVNTKYFFPSKLMEFLATGRPVISTCTGHLRDEYGEFCYLLEDETATGLAEMLGLVATDSWAERARRGHSGRAYMSREKTWDTQAARLAAYLNSLARHVKSASSEASCERRRVLIPMSHYLPGHLAGGPIRSIANLVQALGDDFEFRIVTRDRDLGARHPYPGITVATWIPVGKAHVMYLPRGVRGVMLLLRLLRQGDYDLLYLNSFFARLWSMGPILWRYFKLLPARPLLLAPRGEFSRGALAIKPRRKRLYMQVARWRHLYDGMTWQASAGPEEADIRREFGDESIIGLSPIIESASSLPDAQLPEILRIRIAEDLPTSDNSIEVDTHNRISKQPGELRVVFLSRISRKKNLDYALRVLQQCTGAIAFDIFGPLEDARYWSECQALLASCPPTLRVTLCGPVAHEATGALLREYHLFFFPTHGENFGHVISEALGAGCPVLISDQTPWRGLEAMGIGWDLPLSDSEVFVEKVHRCLAMTNEEFAMMSQRARVYGAERNASPVTITQNRNLLLEVSRRGDSSVNCEGAAERTGG
jgi:glycosyltransferase involved in cell wall biosynthesis